MSRLGEDRERLARWAREYGAPILGFLTRMLDDRHQADDLLQEVFCRAWEGRQRYADAGHERAYLFRIATRLVQDEWRRRGLRIRCHECTLDGIELADEVGENPLAILSRIETHHQLNHALGVLSPAQRQVLLLRYYGEFGFERIAEIMNSPLNTVLSHCHRGLSALRQLLVEK